MTSLSRFRGSFEIGTLIVLLCHMWQVSPRAAELKGRRFSNKSRESNMSFYKYSQASNYEDGVPMKHQRIKSLSYRDELSMEEVPYLRNAKYYMEWAKKFKVMMKRRCLWAYTGIEEEEGLTNVIDSGQTATRESGDGEATLLRKVDARQLFWVMMETTVSTVLQKAYKGKKEPKDAWDALKEKCKEKHVSYLVDLREEIGSKKKPNNMLMTAWIKDFESRIKLLEEEDSLKIAESLMGEYFLRTLPKEYDTMKMVLASSKNLGKWDELTEAIIDLEERADGPREPKMGRSYKMATKPETRTCFKCGKKGHLARDCTGRTSEKCGYCGKPGHKEDNCFKKKKAQGDDPKVGKAVFKVESAPPRALMLKVQDKHSAYGEKREPGDLERKRPVKEARERTDSWFSGQKEPSGARKTVCKDSFLGSRPLW